MEGQRGPEEFEGSEGTEAAQVPEESGWTQYLMDFSSSDLMERSSYSVSDDSNYGSPSMLSDAASPSDHHGGVSKKEIIASSSNISGHLHFPTKKLVVKKQKTKKCSLDDLEDTASSPVNSPKVSRLKHTDMNNRIMDDSHGHFRGENSGHVPPFQSGERSSIIIDGKNNEDCRDLKKKGLCLMPFSMLVNYLG